MYQYHHVKILRVIDADTIEVSINLGFKLTRRDKVRLYGCNAYELREPKGKAAKNFVVDMLKDAQNVMIETHKSGNDKYGRYLAKVFIDGVDLSAHLIENGYAKPYMVDK